MAEATYGGRLRVMALAVEAAGRHVTTDDPVARKALDNLPGMMRRLARELDAESKWERFSDDELPKVGLALMHMAASFREDAADEPGSLPAKEAELLTRLGEEIVAELEGRKT